VTHSQRRGQWWAGALVAGVIGGLGDGLAATRHLLLAPDSTRDLVLVSVSLVAAVVVALSAALMLPWLARKAGRPWPDGHWTGFVCGAAAWTVVCLAALLPGWLALLALGVLAIVPGAVVRDSGRPRMIVGLGFLALLAVRVADDRRPRDRGPAPTDPGPDIVLVVVDGLRADQLDRTPKGDLPAMPQLSALVDGGTRFTRALAPATTAVASRRAAIGGVPPWTASPERGWARELSEAGWRTAVFGGPETREVAEEVGFAVVDLDPGWPAGVSAGSPGQLWMRAVDAQGGRRSGTRVVQAWSSWVDGLPVDRPAASVIHLTELTWPTQPSPPWDTAFQRAPAELGADAQPVGACATEAKRHYLDNRAEVRASFDGAAAAVDALVPEIWAKAATRARGAMVFVVGSRGTPMGEEGRWLTAGGAVHPADTRVLLAVFGQDVPSGSTIGAPVSTVDVVGTLRARAQLGPVSDSRPIPGLVRGYPPRDAAMAVSPEGAVLVLTTDGAWRRAPDGALTHLDAAEVGEASVNPAVPVPVLPPVDAERPLCLR
jgi:hypothetical protein